LAGSIADELGPTPAPEAASAVADFDGVAPEPYRPAPQPEAVSPSPALQHAEPAEPARAPASQETAQEAERAAARRRSTVREKVNFLVSAQPEAAPVSHSQPEPAPPAPVEPAPTATDSDQPRKAGWWSRRFGNGE
jgi:ribonuclease E